MKSSAFSRPTVTPIEVSLVALLRHPDGKNDLAIFIVTSDLPASRGRKFNRDLYHWGFFEPTTVVSRPSSYRRNLSVQSRGCDDKSCHGPGVPTRLSPELKGPEEP